MISDEDLGESNAAEHGAGHRQAMT